MKKYLSIITTLIFVIGLALGAIYLKKSSQTEESELRYDIGVFTQQKRCARHPNFLKKLKIPQPLAIDLSQQNYKGLAFLYGKGLKEALHLQTWEKFDHFSTYALDPQGTMYLSPMPFISIKENTFAFQKNIYSLNSDSGKLSLWMRLDEVNSGLNNPYGIISLVYDCDDHTLWVSAIDESDYHSEKGVIYQIDVKRKLILQRVEGIDALSIALLRTSKGKYLLYGSARESGMFAIKMLKGTVAKPVKLFELPLANEYIRKIKVRKQNLLEIQTIPFSYSLVAETSSQLRHNYKISWNQELHKWIFK